MWCIPATKRVHQVKRLAVLPYIVHAEHGNADLRAEHGNGGAAELALRVQE
ncbi:MAG: hypothetical protein OXU40_09475 [Nitrospira sp.]|nr:hypothetical protein [Nitrospira sp.]